MSVSSGQPIWRSLVANFCTPAVLAAFDAGQAIMEVYDGDHQVELKADQSPLTAADRASHAIIMQRLQQLWDFPVLSEESREVPWETRRQWKTFWLVDPLDGTKEFIKRNGEFTVNIALIEQGRPVLGVVFAPELDRLFAGAAGRGSFVEDKGLRRPIATRQPPAEGLTVVASRSHGDAEALAAFLDGRKVARQTNAGSSLKLCLVAAGEADVYPRLGRTMEWDIAAGDAVLRAAGGCVHELDGSPLRYGKADFANPHFAAWGTANGA